MKCVQQHAVVTGLGFITSIGNDEATVCDSLRNLKSGVVPHRFLGEEDRSTVEVAATVDGFDFSAPSWAGWTFPEAFDLPRELLRSLPPHGVYAYCAIEQALAEAGLSKEEFSSPRIGLFCASAGSPMLMYRYLEQLHAYKGRRGNPMGVVSTIAGTLNFNLAAHYHIEGSNTGFVSACASSNHAIGYALDEIRTGRQDAIMVVGAEDFTAESLLPFAAMNALSPGKGSDASRPWDVSRDGFVATGGAAALLIESEAFAARRGATPLARVTGWGQSSDGVDRTASHPEGNGLARALQNALEDAEVEAASIDYINAHATSTKVGDISEARAIEKVFHAKDLNPEVSSTKGLTGHGLSMAGAVEAGFCTLFLKEGFRAGNAHLVETDPACAHLNLPRQSEDRILKRILSNSSGFGGANVVIVMERA